MTIKAEITEVQIGVLKIQGLMSEDGDFGVAVPQLVDLDLIPPKRSAKQLEALLGKGFQSHEIMKWKTPLHPKAVNVMPLENFQTLVRELDKRGNKAASDFVDSLFGLSLHQLFCDAFGRKFEAQDRQVWLTTRYATKHDFRPLTDRLKAFGFTEPSEYARFVWAFQSKLGIESGTRDELDIPTLVALQGAQVRLTTFMDCGLSPWEAIRKM